MTACGWVPIEEVQVGDWVWARDEVTGEVRLCEVEETYRNESPVILEVTVGGETLATTPGHPFWVLDHGWKDAGELEVGDHLVNLRGESVVVEDIRRRPVPEAVYNFSVAGLHTYFVGQGGIWVHNNSGSGCAGKVAKGAKKPLPAVDSTGKVHGELPRPKDLPNYSPEELESLLPELKQSVQKRIEVTEQLGRDKPHGQRQGAEQNLIKSIEKLLEDM